MAAPTKTLLVLLFSLLLFSFFPKQSSSSPSPPSAIDDDLEDDIAFLESQETESTTRYNYENYDDLDDEDGNHGHGTTSLWPSQEEEKDVAVLKKENFSEFLETNRYVMVEFYAPWCGHCQVLAPEYAAAATELKGVAALAKVDATEDNELAQKYEVQGFPTVYLFVDGVHMTYEGERSKDAIVAWVKKKTGPAIYNITTTKEAEDILATQPKVVLGFLDSLVGSESEELADASRFEDDVNFYQTIDPEVAKLFHIDQITKRPALVLLKEEDEKISHFAGEFSKMAIAEFVSINKFPLVITFSRETTDFIFKHPIKNKLLLFTTKDDSEKFIPMLQETAKAYKGKFVFVYIEMDNEDYGLRLSNYYGVSGDAPRVLVYTGSDDQKKFVLDAELTSSSIKSFAADFLADKLKPFYKSDPIPETNNGDVKIIVGKNFDEIVLDESKDVLLEIYAPWCGHCEVMEPTYNKLGKYLRDVDSLVIAKMDGTTNEHPRAKNDGFPTLLFFPAGKKSFDPITVETDRTVVAFYKFLKKHASIPFKLQKPDTMKNSKSDDSSMNDNSNDNDVKDEL